jgi:hypothetical protein
MLHEHRRIGFGGAVDGALGQAGSLGGALEEPVFFDEPAGAAGPARVSETPFAVDVFPDEDLSNSRSAIDLAHIGSVERPAGPAEQAASLGTIGGIRPSLLALFFLAAALAAFGTVRACQVRGVSPVAVWQLIGR